MKKKNIINLIKYYSEKNDDAFRTEAEEIAKEFDREGDSEIASYIMGILSDANVFVPQIDDSFMSMLEKVDIGNESLWLPDSISKDLLGITNVIANHRQINKYLFYGMPGTGKTEAAKQVARVLRRDLLMVNFANIIDSKLGNTSKNISNLFREINHFPQPNNIIILFDEIDAIALDRTNSQDHREMGRATTTLLKEIDHMHPEIVLIATTNLYNYFDKAILRRFDACVDFDRYSDNDLMEISESFLDKYIKEFQIKKIDIRIFRKIFTNKQLRCSPGEIKNIIKTSVAFSNPQIEGDYLSRLYEAFCLEKSSNIYNLQKQGFTVREIGLLTGKSKSTVNRALLGGLTDE